MYSNRTVYWWADVKNVARLSFLPLYNTDANKEASKYQHRPWRC